MFPLHRKSGKMSWLRIWKQMRINWKYWRNQGNGSGSASATDGLCHFSAFFTFKITGVH